jgi:hypothetical protein
VRLQGFPQSYLGKLGKSVIEIKILLAFFLLLINNFEVLSVFLCYLQYCRQQKTLKP